jgi:hypothetical protein
MTSLNRPATNERKTPFAPAARNHHFGSLIMLAVTAGGFLLVT